jgi:hypothetical protein
MYRAGQSSVRLRDWQRSGIVRIDGNEIVIVKRDALEDVVQTG